MENITQATSFATDRVSFLAKYLTLLSKSTADNQVPTPGYMYQEICNITFESGSHCHSVLDYLIQRLNKPSYHIKLKVLRIMKFIVEKGHPEFYQLLRKNASGIQQATGFSGPPDPLHGNAPYIMVRSTAKELSQLLFEVNLDASSSQRHPVRKSDGGIGMGSCKYSGQMEGFGNIETASDSTLKGSILKGIQSLTSGMANSRPADEQLSEPFNKFGSYQPAQLQGTLPVDRPAAHVVPAAVSAQSPSRTVKKHRPGVAGGGWEEEEEEDAPPPEQQVSDSTETANLCLAALEQERISDWTKEEDLFKQFEEAATGQLSRQHISDFIKRCSAVNCDIVFEILGDKLRSGNEALVLKYLLVLESLLRTEFVNFDHLAESLGDVLQTIIKNGAETLQWKANKIVKILEKLCNNLHPTQASSSEPGHLIGISENDFSSDSLSSQSTPVHLPLTPAAEDSLVMKVLDNPIAYHTEPSTDKALQDSVHKPTKNLLTT